MRERDDLQDGHPVLAAMVELPLVGEGGPGEPQEPSGLDLAVAEG